MKATHRFEVPTLFETAKMLKRKKNCGEIDPSETSKKTKRTASYRDDYREDWPFMLPGHKGKEFAWCDYCEKDISVKCGGRNDIERHVKTELHEANARKRKELEKNKKVTGFFCKATR